MMRKSAFAAALMALCVAMPAVAADITRDPGDICVPLPASSHLMTIESDAALTDEVVRMMNEAVAVADDPEWTAYSRPTFTWASEAKVACGIAYGYMQSSYRDEQFLTKCDCFHRRMQYYLN